MSYKIDRRLGQEPVVADEQCAWALFARAPAVSFVVSGEPPVLRTLRAIVLDGRLCFHGGDHSENLGLLDQRVMASYEEIVAQVASYSVHPELLACSVSTYYQSAIASGVVRRVDDIDRKARIVSAMMERLQPEGGYKSTVNAHSHSSEVPEKLLVCELLPEQIGAERKLGQGRTRAQIEQLLEWLWRRGQAGDVAAIRTILEAHPDAPEPRFLSTADERFVLAVSPNRPDARAVAELLRGEYWTHDFSAELMERAHLGTPAWVVARARDGSVVGSARVVSDGARFGYLMDVIVRRDLRGVGLGQALTRLVLDHPEVRQVLRIRLRTRDAQPFYEPLGFKSLVSHPNSTEMVRIRD